MMQLLMCHQNTLIVVGIGVTAIPLSIAVLYFLLVDEFGILCLD